MSIRSLLGWWPLWVVLACCAPRALAQREIPHIPPFIDSEGDEPDLVHPFVDPFAFKHDFQFFAPFDPDVYGNEPKPRTGWFATYDRMYLNITRPESVLQPFEGDFTWGNRINLGWMSEEDHGWLFESFFMGGPRRGQNNMDITTVRIDKTFRLKQRHFGSVIEPMIGLRFSSLNDATQYDPVIDRTFHVENYMLGPEFGFRWFKQKGRWNLSADFLMFPLHNWQHYFDESQTNFVFGGEVRAQAALYITRDLALRVGLELTHLGRGVSRNDQRIDNDEDVTMAGVTFGGIFNY